MNEAGATPLYTMTEERPKTKKIIAIRDIVEQKTPDSTTYVAYENDIIDFPIDEPAPHGWREATWQDLVNEKSSDKVKRFLHPLTIDRLKLQVCIPPSQYRLLKNFTFYRIEAPVNKKKEEGVFTFYLTDYDAREDKGGYEDGVIPHDCWCLFTFHDGRRAMQFFTQNAIGEITLAELNSVLQKMFDSLQ